jgi:hypothetical protein
LFAAGAAAVGTSDKLFFPHNKTDSFLSSEDRNRCLERTIVTDRLVLMVLDLQTGVSSESERPAGRTKRQQYQGQQEGIKLPRTIYQWRSSETGEIAAASEPQRFGSRFLTAASEHDWCSASQILGQWRVSPPKERRAEKSYIVPEPERDRYKRLYAVRA